MGLSKIGLAYHQIGRAKEIIGIALKYGFGAFVTRSGFGRIFVSKKRLSYIESHTKNQRIRMAIEDLGPTFIKFGQILADRPDLISKDLRAELKRLQDAAHPLDDNIAIQEIEKQLKKPIKEVFKELNPKHIASASIGQAYKGTLKSGEEVVVKIQRPGIDKKIKLDLSLMSFFAERVQKSNPEFQAINIVGVVEEFGKSIKNELNFSHEASNAIRFARMFEKDSSIYTPKIFSQYTSTKILVEEFISGFKVDDIEVLKKNGIDPVEIAHNGARLIFEQIFNFGFFHADPHSGNIFILKDGRIVFIDFGMMGKLRPYQLDFLGKYVMGYLQKDPHKMTESLLLLSGKKHFDRFEELEFEISDMMKQYQYSSLKEINFGEVMNKSIDIIVAFGLSIPPTIYLLIKALITIEGVATMLNPKIDIAKEMQPFATTLLKKQFSPLRFAKDFYRTVGSFFQLLHDLPGDISEIMYKTKQGQLKIQLDHKGLEPMIMKIDQVSKRISIAIILAALIIGAAIISVWEHTRWVGSAIFLGAGFFAFWMLAKLIKKGKI